MGCKYKFVVRGGHGHRVVRHEVNMLPTARGDQDNVQMVATLGVSCLHQSVEMQFVQRVVQPVVTKINVLAPVWGVAPNGVLDVAKHDIALVHVNQGIMPPPCIRCLESILIENPQSQLVEKLQCRAQEGTLVICKKQGALITIVSTKWSTDQAGHSIDGPRRMWVIVDPSLAKNYGCYSLRIGKSRLKSL